MARALRRTLSPQIQERTSGGARSCSSSSSGSGVNSAGMLQNGGGGVAVFATEKTYEHHNIPHGHGSPLTSLSGGASGPTGFASGSLPSSGSHPDNLFSLTNLSLIFPLSWLRFMGRPAGSMERLPKSKGTFFRRPMMHLLLCLVLGIFMGCTSVRWPGLLVAKGGKPHDRNLLNGFVTNMQMEGIETVSRGGKLVDFDTWSQNAAVAEMDDAETTEETENSRGLRIEQPESVSLDVAPGLNYTLDPERKLLIIITATYNRAFQAHYLTRLAHTLRLVPPPLLWLVVEMPYQTVETAGILRETGIMYRHLVCRSNSTAAKDRGVHQRNFALEHIEIHQLNGIVYFADDDNVYSQELFEEMRKIKRFGTWPVGMLAESKAKAIVEGPVCDGNKVIGWHTNEKSKKVRRFHVDMSGFAFNSTILWDTESWRPGFDGVIRQLDTVKEGLQETTFIEQLIEDEYQMEGLPSGCSKIMVWHLHMEALDLAYPYGWSLPKPLHPSIPLRIQI